MKELWEGWINQAANIDKNFISRVVGLNKVHRNVPTAAENRLIVIESQLRLQRSEDLLKYISREVQIVNVFNRMCPICRQEKMSIKHLRRHRVFVPTISRLFLDTIKKVEKAETKWRSTYPTQSRKDLILEDSYKIRNTLSDFNKFLLLSIQIFPEYLKIYRE